ncbi:MAG: zinc-ribbon domain containing protein [Prosthecobacter sp.]
MDAWFYCADCGVEFAWRAQEQKLWFEAWRFYVDSQPTRCRECHGKHRNLHRLRQDYDDLVGEARAHGTVEQKERILDILEELESAGIALSDKMRETREIFCRQLTKHDFPG